MSVYWLRRGPFKCVHVGFAIGRKSLEEALHRVDAEDATPEMDLAATREVGHDAAIVYLAKAALKMKKADVHEMLVHEATHVRQFIEKATSDVRPSDEVQAYVTQWIWAWLRKCYKKEMAG